MSLTRDQKRQIRRGLMFALLLQLALCFGTATAQQPIGEQIEMRQAFVVLDQGVAQLLDLLHWRLQNHPSLRTHEYAACLRGELTADTTYIWQVSAAVVDSVKLAGVWYGCRDEPDLIGATHNHPTGTIGCGVSMDDLIAINMHERQRVIMHTCDDGFRTYFVIRRRGYRPVVLPFADGRVRE